jgi:hypothetical protein
MTLVGGVTAGQKRQLHDPVIRLIREKDIAFGVHRWPFSEGDGGSDLDFLGHGRTAAGQK